jgi:hypothetical protein
MVEHKPTKSDLPMNAPEADQQIVSGVFQLENDKWRWTSGTAVILLKSPSEPTPLVVRFFIPDSAPARQIKVELDNQVVAAQTYTAPGSYTLMSPPQKPAGDSARVTITADKTFSTQSDARQLGLIVTEVGFTQP